MVVRVMLDESLNEYLLIDRLYCVGVLTNRQTKKNVYCKVIEWLLQSHNVAISKKSQHDESIADYID
jgi:predicted nucleic-acid-binding protein